MWVGVKTDDIDEARRWVAEAIGIPGVEKEHVDMGGQYFKFESSDVSLSLINNFDIYDHEPISPPEFGDWKLVLSGDNIAEVSVALEKLAERSDRFEVLTS